MCVLIVKPAGVRMPGSDIFKAARLANPHGCGFVSPSKSYKGLDFNRFMALIKTVPETEPCIIHFRLATHGSIKAANCHPFVRGDVFFAHNGILDVTPRGDMTDSETAFASYIYPAIEHFGYHSPQVDAIVDSLIGCSKFAMLKGHDVRMFGRFTDVGGVFYSNLRFQYYLPLQKVC